MFRGEKEEVLDLDLDPGEADGPTRRRGRRGEFSDYETRIAGALRRRRPGPAGRPLARRHGPLAWRARILVHLGVDLRMRLWQRGRGRGGRRVRREPARPAAGRARRGPDDDGPGPRLPHRREGRRGRRDRQGGRDRDDLPARAAAPAAWDGASRVAALARLAAAHQVELIAIGNGTASRETDRLAADLIKAHPELKLTKIVVSEAGASVYSASAYASRELPGMDVSLRGAVSIARRLQDPLAELVKIDPKSIGVGQYQHDLAEAKLSRSLDAVVEDCVNAVGVDVNTASAPLLARVSGISEGLAGEHRGAPGRRTGRSAAARR